MILKTALVLFMEVGGHACSGGGGLELDDLLGPFQLKPFWYSMMILWMSLAVLGILVRYP